MQFNRNEEEEKSSNYTKIRIQMDKLSHKILMLFVSQQLQWLFLLFIRVFFRLLFCSHFVAFAYIPHNLHFR